VQWCRDVLKTAAKGKGQRAKRQARFAPCSS